MHIVPVWNQNNVAPNKPMKLLKIHYAIWCFRKPVACLLIDVDGMSLLHAMINLTFFRLIIDACWSHLINFMVFITVQRIKIWGHISGQYINRKPQDISCRTLGYQHHLGQAEDYEIKELLIGKIYLAELKCHIVFAMEEIPLSYFRDIFSIKNN